MDKVKYTHRKSKKYFCGLLPTSWWQITFIFLFPPLIYLLNYFFFFSTQVQKEVTSNWAHSATSVCRPRHPSIWEKRAKRLPTRQGTNSSGGPAPSVKLSRRNSGKRFPTTLESGWPGRGWGWASRRLWLRRSDFRTPPSSAPSELEIKINCVKQRPQVTLQRNLQHLPGRLEPRLLAKSRGPTRLPQPVWAAGATPQLPVA